MRQPRIVKHQKTRVIQSRKDYKGEQSPYWDYARENSMYNDEGDPVEHAQANPDVLPESATVFPREIQGLSVGDITKQLSGQQLKVFELYVQEGKKEKEIAQILRISEKTVRTYLQRIREKYQYYV